MKGRRGFNFEGKMGLKWCTFEGFLFVSADVGFVGSSVLLM